ncbi:MAG: ADP-ribosylglycohydrolase family protein [Anaerolineae bacterium]|jgi:ADP-ribosylglycohydrolase|nr:ADP-ribosylglycohydrolase family protein [Anaerolineae bacterium]
MATNREILERFFESGEINLQRSKLFDIPPTPMPDSLDFDRVEGMLLGVAIGDALGGPSEGQTPARRQAHYGEIRDYLPTPYTNGAPHGLPSDDTQLTFWTIEQLLEDRELIPDHIAARFCRGCIIGIGSTVKQFIRHYHTGVPWYRCGLESAGNGALMRITPILLPYLRSPSPDLWVDTALLAMLTHNDRASTAACLTFAAMLWELLQRDTAPEPLWWIDRYVSLARELEGDTTYVARGGGYPDYKAPLWQLVATKVPEAYRQGIPVREACDIWLSGAYLFETVPSILYILMHHANDPEEALVRAVNDTKDNDTIAAVVGAAVGALHGRKGFPQRWIAALPGYTTDRDEGRVYELIAQARAVWWDDKAS